MSATSAYVVDQTLTSSKYVPATLQTLSGNGGTIEVSGKRIVRVDAGGTSRTGTILQAGVSGQDCIVLNEGAEVIDMAAAATSNIAGASGSVGWQPGQAYHYVWDATNSLWAPVGQALS